NVVSLDTTRLHPFTISLLVLPIVGAVSESP
ncbi:unnamed protein product, partial [Allacma fusca]